MLTKTQKTRKNFLTLAKGFYKAAHLVEREKESEIDYAYDFGICHAAKQLFSREEAYDVIDVLYEFIARGYDYPFLGYLEGISTYCHSVSRQDAYEGLIIRAMFCDFLAHSL